MENHMNDEFKCDFEPERSNEVELVASNLEAILKSSTYKLAHEDIDLLNTDEMRGVRMLLEITKPEQILEKEKDNFNCNCFWGCPYIRRNYIQKKVG